MGQFEEILHQGTRQELDDLKQWLFRENIRLETERREIQAMQLKFAEERQCFLDEMRTLNKKILSERKRLKEENLFFEKKLDILKNGFAQLEKDRKKLQKEKEYLLEDQKSCSYSGSGTLFFKGVKNSLTLKKRYKDLIKIFHPDNVCGDKDAVQTINKEYEKLRREL